MGSNSSDNHQVPLGETGLVPVVERYFFKRHNAVEEVAPSVILQRELDGCLRMVLRIVRAWEY
jgi:hypothetical protein